MEPEKPSNTSGCIPSRGGESAVELEVYKGTQEEESEKEYEFKDRKRPRGPTLEEIKDKEKKCSLVIEDKKLLLEDLFFEENKENMTAFLSSVGKEKMVIYPIYTGNFWFIKCPLLKDHKKFKETYFPKVKKKIDLDYLIKLKDYLQKKFDGEYIRIKLISDGLIYISKFRNGSEFTILGIGRWSKGNFKILNEKEITLEEKDSYISWARKEFEFLNSN